MILEQAVWSPVSSAITVPVAARVRRAMGMAGAKYDAGRAVAAERGPQPEHHSSGLEEADLVIGLLGPRQPSASYKRARLGQ